MNYEMVEKNKELESKAKELAYEIHKDEVCFLSNEKKIYHLEAVVIILKSLISVNNDTIIAGYLHDILDYCEPGMHTKIKEKIQSLFGIHVLKLVEEVSDNFRLEDIVTPEGYNAFCKKTSLIHSPSSFSAEAATITLVEKVANLEAMERELNKVGAHNYWPDFENHYSMKKSQIRDYYETIYGVLADRCIGNYRLRKLLDRYDYLIDKIFYN